MKTFLFLFLISFSALADVTVVTYNMAQLKKMGLDLVACTKRRVGFQVDAMFNEPTAPMYASKDFVYLIQESWTKRSFNALRKIAKERNYTFYPDDFNIVKNAGDLIISNLKADDVKHIPFSSDKYAQKGILYARLKLDTGKTFGVINVHTGYSDMNGFSEEHRKHFEELGRAIQEFKPNSDYFAVGGDFNAGPDMGFKKTKYDSAKLVWEDGLMPHMINQGMRLLPSVGVTWDDTNNTLANVPPLLLRLVNKYKNGYISWDQTDSTLDHIFVTNEEKVSRHELVFNKKVHLNCGKRDDKDGLFLSDHYGVMATVMTEEAPVTSGEVITVQIP